MLVNIHVKNFALIEEAEIDLKEGLNILTGETGAGKSILIDAVSSALGLRVSSDVIRSGCDSAYVELVFAIPEEERRKQLEDLEISTEYDCIVISRKILPNRSIHKINDETVSSSKVRAVTELLLDIHGQHEHQSLLKNSKHLEILDDFAGETCSKLKEEVRTAHKNYQTALKHTKDFTMSEEERLRRLDFLEYEIHELEQAAIRPGEKEQLTEVFREMSHFEKIERVLGSVLTELGDHGVGDSLGRASRELNSISGFGEALSQMAEELQTIEGLIRELSREAEDYLRESRFSPEEYKKVEDRLDLIHRLESKFGDLSHSYETILEERISERDSLLNYEQERIRADQAKDRAEAELKKLSFELRELRMQAAPQLSAVISDALKELNFLSVDFSVFFEEPTSYTAGGMDEVEFRISLNPGEEPKALGKVASGGELSRIMLAIKTILADKDRIPSVIFDEVDTGISGRTAQLVGRKLKEIAAYRQVILITHLPQIAALADTHFGIEKWSEQNRTRTRIRELKEEDSVLELARLLGGLEITDSVLQAARDLKHGGKR